MGYFTFNQKRQIRSGIHKISKDIDSFVGKKRINSIRISLKHSTPDVDFGLLDYGAYDLFAHRKWSLVRSSKYHEKEGWQILIEDENGWEFDRDISLSKIKIRDIDELDYLAWLEFIKSYPENRKTIKEAIEQYKDDKNMVTDSIKSSLQELERLKDASIELNFPETLAQKEIEIEKKDGQTIGTINFGDRSIRIITNGDIVLVPKREEEKQKVKSNG